LFDSLAPQVELIVLVDNGSGALLKDWLGKYASDKLITILLECNLGLAAAQNRGISEARRYRVEYVSLSDQDSLPASDMVARLCAVADHERGAARKVAALGPVIIDGSQGVQLPFVRIGGYSTRRVDCNSPGQTVEVDHLIASGSLIPLAVQGT
jgi:rhamnosyltransferase